MHVALYRGISAVSLAIRFITRSRYSHAAFLFDASAVQAAQHMVASGVNLRSLKINRGAVVEAWSGGVKTSTSLSTLHTPGTVVDIFNYDQPLTPAEEEMLIAWLVSVIGAPYDYRDIICFLTRQRGRPGDTWFCSRLVDEMSRRVGRPFFRETPSWKVPPGWLAMTLALRFSHSIITSKPGHAIASKSL